MNPIIERLYQAAKGQTHWEGCEESHLLCASVKEIERLEQICRKLTEQLELMHKFKKKIDDRAYKST
jgi:hypothetical protein